MKHIKRKTLLEFNLPSNLIEKINPSSDEFKKNLKELKYKDVKEKHALLIMDTGEAIRSFFFNDNGRACTIPLANPVLIYFNFAQSLLKNITLTKEKLLIAFTGDDEVTEDALKLFYDYFGLVSSYVSMLMTSLEAFVNQKIDIKTKYIKPEGKKYDRVYDYEQIQRWIPLSEKIDKILDPQVKLSFKRVYPIKQQHIANLKEIRDLIIHTKSGENHDTYIDLYRKSLGFNFQLTIEAVKEFINFYQNGLIEPCPCGVDS